jgi:senataxin
VTPYKEQRRALRRAFGHRFGHYSLPSVEISTVDGYQGQEKEIIIFSCVRTGSSQGIGFLNDARRLNVAITRAKTSLFILGKSSALLQNQLWRGLIEDAKQRQCFRHYDPETWREWQRLPSPKNLAPPATKTPSRPIEVQKAAPLTAAQPQMIKGPMQRRMEAASQKPM